MTKTDIVGRVANKTGLSKKESSGLIEHLFAIMKDSLESGENLKINGFGSFVVRQKNDRIGRNPQTGEDITIKARRVLTFKSSTLLKKSINS